MNSFVFPSKIIRNRKLRVNKLRLLSQQKSPFFLLSPAKKNVQQHHMQWFLNFFYTCTPKQKKLCIMSMKGFIRPLIVSFLIIKSLSPKQSTVKKKCKFLMTTLKGFITQSFGDRLVMALIVSQGNWNCHSLKSVIGSFLITLELILWQLLQVSMDSQYPKFTGLN